MISPSCSVHCRESNDQARLGVLKGMRATMRDSRDLGRLLAQPKSERPVVFYAEDAFTFVQYSGYVEALAAHGSTRVKYVTSDPDDPILGDLAPAGVDTYYVDKQLPRLMERLDSAVLAITMPDLGRYHVRVPPVDSVVYLFHSLNSVHTAYRTGAFDHYDVFFCTGPHHVTEMRELRRSRGLPPAELLEIGYHKLDRITAAHAAHRRIWPADTTVLIAPSWGPGNILEACGRESVASLRSHGFRVVVRPHPQFFHSLYPAGASIIERLEREFEEDNMVVFERSITTEDTFHEAALMVSDWSGAAFEYSLGTLRPTLFVDTPQKLFNHDWEGLGLPSFERSMRQEVGQVLSVDFVGEIGSSAAALIDRGSEYRERLDQLRGMTVFNVGQAGLAGAEALATLGAL